MRATGARLGRARPRRRRPRPPSWPRPSAWCAATSSSRTPRTITPIGLELRLEVEVGEPPLRGIIDRLELDADGELVVTDYKTGRAPPTATSRPSSAACTSTPCCASGSSGAARPASSCSTCPSRSPSPPSRPSSRPAASRAGRGASGRRSSGPASARTSAPARPAVRLVRVPGLLPGVRRRPRSRRRSTPAWPSATQPPLAPAGASPHGMWRARLVASAVCHDRAPDRPVAEGLARARPSTATGRGRHRGRRRGLAAGPPPRVVAPAHGHARRLRRRRRRAGSTALRGIAPVDRVMYSVTELADFSLMWHLLGAGPRACAPTPRGRGPAALGGARRRVDPRQRRAQVACSGGSGRSPSSSRPHHLRMPLTTSFPSGHASAAFCAGHPARRRPAAPAQVGWFGLAAVVAASRVHVQDPPRQRRRSAAPPSGSPWAGWPAGSGRRRR